MRSMVSYDDITLPYQSNSEPLASSPKPPSKKRKWSNAKSKHSPQSRKNVKYTESASATDWDQESRELTHDEIWDDSALIDAWNAATEEYEAYNGPDKSWKAEPVHKSPLWYNTPISSSKNNVVAQNDSGPPTSKSFVDDSNIDAEVEDGDSQPLDFDTFVPIHNASLELPASSNLRSIPDQDHFPFQLPEPPGPTVSRDEAFNRAMGAVYWAGYWTAVYHGQRNVAQERQPVDNGNDECDDTVEVKEESDVEGDDDFVSTQR